MRGRTFIRALGIAASVFLLACTAPAAAQDSAQGSKPQPPANREFKHKARIEVKYDRFEDETHVKLEPTRVLGGFYEDVKMGASFFYKGQKVSAPDYFYILFVTNTKEWRFLRDSQRELTALADGERLALGTLDRDSHVRESGRVSEIMVKEIPYETFLKIVNAKKVEMKLGSYEFELKEELLEALRDLASRTAQ
jgi:hypothetical protein